MSSKRFFLLHMFCVILIQLDARFADSNNIITRCIDEEREALLAFKQSLVDESGVLSSWGREDEKRDCCKWRGVRCSNTTGHVIVLNLQPQFDSPGNHLKGIISPALLKLHHLRQLDLSLINFGGSPVPEFIGSLSKLRYLILYRAKFVGPIPPQLGNLSRLKYLDLGFNNLFSVGDLDWLSHLSSLTHLDLSWNNLSKSSGWFQVVGKLHSLTTLSLYWCDLPPVIPSSISFLNANTSLETIDLSYNSFTSSIYPWLFNVSRNIVGLNLGNNQLEGPIPDAFEDMGSFKYLTLFHNEFEGGIPKFFGNMCSLIALDLSENKLNGQFSEFIQNLSSGCTRNRLETLYLDSNGFMGPMPDLGGFSSVKNLFLRYNRLNGTINKSLGRMFKLEALSLSGNSFKGVISEAFFSNLSNLQTLHLADNSLALELSHDWIPPFQLSNIYLSSCMMGPRFPKWLRTQNEIERLDISNVGIIDTVPDWFWDLTHQLSFLNISNNQITGKLPNLSLRFHPYGALIDISSNHFEGPIPPLPSNVTYLDLSKNKFSDSISFLCSINGHILTHLDLSDNLFSGSLPDCWLQFDSLVILNLANNRFFGKIPDSMGFIYNIQSLSLYNNSLTGGLPTFSMNVSRLIFMDLGKNGLSGEIPAWIGENLPKLAVLSLKSNNFHGNIPLQLCRLAFIQVLDLSSNNITGTIPKCFKQFTVMTQERSFSSTITSEYNYSLDISNTIYLTSYFANILLTWKGSEYEYKRTLGLVKILDLSVNNLSGEVPEEIMDLVGLLALNLSRNNLTGQITPKIGQLKSLDFLDLSRNKIFGEIPASLSQLSLLGVLDLSNNNLSGKIPSGTQLQSFNASVYAGNPELCGLPLPNKCPKEESGPNDIANTAEDEDQFITLGFYVSLILGFIVGFWGVCGTLLLNHSWRYGFFNFLTGIKDWLYVTVAMSIAKLQRRFRK